MTKKTGEFKQDTRKVILPEHRKEHEAEYQAHPECRIEADEAPEQKPQIFCQIPDTRVVVFKHRPADKYHAKDGIPLEHVRINTEGA